MDWTKQRYLLEWSKALAPVLLGLLVYWGFQSRSVEQDFIFRNEASDHELVQLVLELSREPDPATREALLRAALTAFPSDGSADIRRALELLSIEAGVEITTQPEELVALDMLVAQTEASCDQIAEMISARLEDVAYHSQRLETFQQQLLSVVDETQTNRSIDIATERLSDAEDSLGQLRLRLVEFCQISDQD